MSALTDRLGGMDSAKAAGLLVIGSVVLLGLIRKGFKGVTVHVGD